MSKPLIETTAEKAALQDTAARRSPTSATSPAASAAGPRSRSTGSPDDNSTGVEVSQPATEEAVLFNVPCELALDALYHPFSHITAEGERWNARA